MHIGLNNRFVADEGKHFVLTERGYRQTPVNARSERKIGEPIPGFETSVPRSWITNWWVKEKVRTNQ